MKRTTETGTETEVIRWKNISRKSFTMPNRIIKPGQEFKASLSAIPVNFRDVIIPLDDIVLPEAPKPPVQKPPKKQAVATGDVEPTPATVTKYFVKPRGGAWYDVVDVDGKVLNEKALREPAAKELVETLQ